MIPVSGVCGQPPFYPEDAGNILYQGSPAQMAGWTWEHATNNKM